MLSQDSQYDLDLSSVDDLFLTITVYLFLLTVFLTQVVFVSGLTGYIFPILGYSLFFLYFILFTDMEISGDRNLVISLFLFCIILFLSSSNSPTLQTLLRMVSFPIFIFINIFVIPSLVPKSAIYDGISRMSAMFVLVGLPAIISGSFGPIPSYSVISAPLASPVELYGLTSFFANPNTMGVIAVLGTFATLWGLFTNKSILLVFLFFVNLSGVYFSQGRASALALLAGFVLIGTYYVADRTGLIVITISGLVFSPVFLLMTFGLIPGFDLVQNINLNNRIPLWTAAYHAFMDRPLLGWGIGNVPDAMSPYISRPYLEGNDPHSSYIRMFTATGLIGGTVYIYILLNVLWIRLSHVANKAEATEYGMIVSILILQTFSGISIFGLAAVSVLPAIVLGYSQSRS